MMQLLGLWKYVLWIQSIRPGFLAGRKNVIHVHKKSQMYIVHNHRPLSLLPVASKIFQAIYNDLLNYIEHENINQFSFHAKGSCIN